MDDSAEIPCMQAVLREVAVENDGLEKGELHVQAHIGLQRLCLSDKNDLETPLLSLWQSLPDLIAQRRQVVLDDIPHDVE